MAISKETPLRKVTKLRKKLIEIFCLFRLDRWYVVIWFTFFRLLVHSTNTIVYCQLYNCVLNVSFLVYPLYCDFLSDSFLIDKVLGFNALDFVLIDVLLNAFLDAFFLWMNYRPWSICLVVWFLLVSRFIVGSKQIIVHHTDRGAMSPDGEQPEKKSKHNENVHTIWQCLTYDR